nr:MAG TPA: hypothetical protein [Caudoviricetes sp.]
MAARLRKLYYWRRQYRFRGIDAYCTWRDADLL